MKKVYVVSFNYEYECGGVVGVSDTFNGAKKILLGAVDDHYISDMQIEERIINEIDAWTETSKVWKYKDIENFEVSK